MTEEQKVTVQRAKDDLDAIKNLSEFTPFTGYFLGRLKSRRDKLEDSFRNDPPAKVDAAEREILRRLIKQLDEILTMTADDKKVAISDLQQLTPPQTRPPEELRSQASRGAQA